MARAASAAGLPLTITSGFRSDAEQASLFAANPDPRWVAPPGRSLHRCGTELDLGPPSSHGWLAANARRFGFEQRYSWEPWHFGFVRRPGALLGGFAGPPRPRRGATAARPEGGGLPDYVPGFVRGPLLAAASRHGVSAALLAAQLLAESDFNPAAISAAGARGIAQFMPATAAAYGLDDPLDPVASIDAQARLMADLLAELRLDRARARRLQRRAGRGLRLRLRGAVRRDRRLRGADPGPARRCRGRRRRRCAATRGQAGRLSLVTMPAATARAPLRSSGPRRDLRHGDAHRHRLRSDRRRGADVPAEVA